MSVSVGDMSHIALTDLSPSTIRIILVYCTCMEFNLAAPHPAVHADVENMCEVAPRFETTGLMEADRSVF